MKPNFANRMRCSSWWNPRLLAAAIFGCVLATQGLAQEKFSQPEPFAGGLDYRPRITNSSQAGTEIVLKWLGVQGPYQIQRSTTLGAGSWTNVGGLLTAAEARVLRGTNNGFFRIGGSHPQFQGNAQCVDCHADKHAGWSKTAHARAFDTLKKIGQQNNPACVVCHTVGAGVPTGFISETATPQFKNVQCENCHGPAGDHLSSGDIPTVSPIVYKSSILCAGCHNDYHHPTYEEWQGSPHGAVVPELATQFSNTNRSAAISSMNNCGSCHSGAVRLAMLSAYNSNTGVNRTNVNWPSQQDAATTPVACMVCHEVHTANTFTNVINGEVYTKQLRNPISSTNVYSYSTSTNFAANYNASVNVCGQCHNARGATVGSSSRPPHYSPQYNIFLGVIGVTSTNKPPQGAHKDNPLQCVGCHTHRHNEANPTPTNPVFTGHGFRPSPQACQVCHTELSGPNSADARMDLVQSEVSAMMVTTKNLLVRWATTKNTNSWASKYEGLGWEYTVPGEVSNPSATPNIVGPNATEQAQIPQGIKDARFNLYLVSRDKSKGVHNAPYVKHLLQTAQQKVQALLDQP